MALSTNTMDFQLVTVAVAGASVAINPQPYDNTDIVVINNIGSNAVRLGIGTAGGAISSADGFNIPSGASFSFPIGTRNVRPGPAFSGTTSLILDSVGGAGSAQVLFMNKTENWGV